MALVITRTDLWGNTKVVMGDHTMPASYVAGGDPSDPGLRVIEGALIEGNTDRRLYSYDVTNKKIIANNFDQPNAASGPGVEVAAAVNLSAQVLKVTFWGQ